LQHTSASLLIQENADPDVRRDLEAFFKRLVPDGDALFVHTAEGADDMSAHIRTALTTVNLSIPSAAGRIRWGRGRGFICGNTARDGSRPPGRAFILSCDFPVAVARFSLEFRVLRSGPPEADSKLEVGNKTTGTNHCKIGR